MQSGRFGLVPNNGDWRMRHDPIGCEQFSFLWGRSEWAGPCAVPSLSGDPKRHTAVRPRARKQNRHRRQETSTTTSHDAPHAAKTLSQPISLENQSAAEMIPTTHVLTVKDREAPEKGGFLRFYERAKTRPRTVVIVEGDHNLQRSKPKELVELLEDTP